VTNTGTTTVNGNVGVSPGSAVTGFPPCVVAGGGTIHSNDAVAIQAQNELTTAYNAAAGTACTADLTGQDLGGMTLTPSAYCFSSSAQLTGALTLNFLGNANAAFIFKIGSTLTTASSSKVLLINGGTSCNVFWQVGSSATLGTTTNFAGNILALTSITLTTGATNSGRNLARNGAVTLGTNQVVGCAVGGVGGLPGGAPGFVPVPFPAVSTWGLIFLILARAILAGERQVTQPIDHRRSRLVEEACYGGHFYRLQFGLLLAPWFRPVVDALSRAMVIASSFSINVLGGHSIARGIILSSPLNGFAIELKDGCNGVNIVILLWSAILHSPDRAPGSSPDWWWEPPLFRDSIFYASSRCSISGSTASPGSSLHTSIFGRL
jgi:hypothetical protein